MDLAHAAGEGAIVFEDDVVLGPSVGRAFATMRSRLPDDCDLAFLELGVSNIAHMARLLVVRQQLAKKDRVVWFDPSDVEFFSTCALYYPAGKAGELAARLRSEPLDRPLDMEFRKLASGRDIKVQAMLPSLVGLSDFAAHSSIQSDDRQALDRALLAYRELVWLDADHTAINARSDAVHESLSPYGKAASAVLGKMVDLYSR